MASSGSPVLEHQGVHLLNGVHQFVVRVVGGQLELQNQPVDFVDHQSERQLFQHGHFDHFGRTQHNAFQCVNYLLSDKRRYQSNMSRGEKRTARIGYSDEGYFRKSQGSPRFHLPTHNTHARMPKHHPTSTCANQRTRTTPSAPRMPAEHSSLKFTWPGQSIKFIR